MHSQSAVPAPTTPEVSAPPRMPPPPGAVVSGQVESRHPSRFANPLVAVRSDVEMGSAPSTPPEAFGRGEGAEQVGQSPQDVAADTGSVMEPDAKRARVCM